jgi:alkylation response protein AidB-like acyl-CoA dehydrogenase
MNFDIDPDTTAIAEAVLRFIEREVLPLEASHHAVLGSERTLFQADGRYVPEALALRRQVRMRSAELGYYNLFGDEKLGGAGQGAQVMAHVQEAINHRYGPGRPLIQTVVLPSPFTNGLSPVLRHLDASVFERYRDGIASGDKTLCFALSEPDAGSDVFAMKARAVRDGEHWVLNGTKQWITNSPYADHAMVFALTDPEAAAQHKGGVTGFFVDTRTPGFSVPRLINTVGHLGGDTGVVVLDNVRVRDDHRLGRRRPRPGGGDGRRERRAHGHGRYLPGPGALGAGPGHRIRQGAQDLGRADRRAPGGAVHAGRQRHGHLRRQVDDPELRLAHRPGPAGHRAGQHGQGLLHRDAGPGDGPQHPGARRDGPDQRTAHRGRLPLRPRDAHPRRHRRDPAPHHRPPVAGRARARCRRRSPNAVSKR